MSENENKLISENRLNNIKINVLKMEQENLKTRAKTSDEMIESIRKVISDELRKNY